MSLTPPRPPQGITYRHNLTLVLALLFVWECIFGAVTYSNFLNKSAWMWFWGAVCVAVLILVLWRLWWLEKYGWWIQRALEIPDLPVKFKGIGWNATFEQEGISIEGQALGLETKSRQLKYSAIKSVEPDQYSGLTVVASGKAPLILGRMSEDDRTRIVLLLASQNSSIEFKGILATTREGWQPRL